MKWIIDNKEWIFSGIGVLFISLIIGLVLNYMKNRKHKNTPTDLNSEPMRKVNQFGDKSLYIEENNGDVTIG